MFLVPQKIIDLIKKREIQIIIICITVLIAYINIFQNDFVFDDPTFIVNWGETRSWQNTINFLKGDIPEGHGGLYRPLRSIIYMISYHIWGNSSAFGYHLQSLIVILGITILVYLITNLIFKKNLIAFIAAILFGLHPVHTEAITFMTASFDSIGVLFFFLSFYLFLKSKYSKYRKRYYIASIFTATIAFFTYESTLTLFIVLGLYDLCFNKFKFKKLNLNSFKALRIYAPYLFIALIYSFIRVILLHIVARGEYIMGSFSLTMLTMTRAIEKYLSLLVFPFHLTTNHEIAPDIFALIWAESNNKVLLAQSIWQPDIFLAITIIVLLILIALLGFIKQPLLTFCIGWFFVTIAPVANIIPQGALMTERYLLIPSFGFCLLAAYSIHYFYNLKILNISKYLQPVLCLTVVVILILYQYTTMARNAEWKDSIALWSSAVREVPTSFFSNGNLGYAYDAKKEYDLALKQTQRLIQLSPDNPQAHQRLGQVYAKLEKYKLAEEEMKKAISLKPDSPQAYAALGLLYKEMAGKSKQPQLEQAVEAFKKAIKITPRPDATLYFNLGALYGIQNKSDFAIENYKKAISINSHYAEPHNNLGVIYFNQKKFDQAIEEYKKAIVIDPNSAESYFNLGKVYYSANQIALAIESYQKAIELDPNFAEPHNNLGIIYTTAKKLDLAESEFNKAITAKKDYAEPYFNLAILYKSRGQDSLANEKLQKGLAIMPNQEALKVFQNMQSSI